MKKLILAIVAMLVIGVTSCKKEDGVQPEVGSEKVSDKKDTTQWD